MEFMIWHGTNHLMMHVKQVMNEWCYLVTFRKTIIPIESMNEMRRRSGLIHKTHWTLHFLRLDWFGSTAAVEHGNLSRLNFWKFFIFGEVASFATWLFSRGMRMTGAQLFPSYQHHHHVNLDWNGCFSKPNQIAIVHEFLYMRHPRVMWFPWKEFPKRHLQQEQIRHGSSAVHSPVQSNLTRKTWFYYIDLF